LQITLGVGLACLIALRGRWYLAPLGALAVRVGTDAYAYPYYGLGPVLFAFVWDACRAPGTRARFGLTLATIAALCVVPAVLHSDTAEAAVRAAWVAGLLVLLRGEFGVGA
jgi:hypothetical protein